MGKSSLINCLVNRKRLARTSSTPGRTQVINFFNIDDRWVFVDLPGYGYAKAPRAVRERWAPMIEEFLAEDQRLALVVAIVDARHKPTPLDQMLVDWLQQLQALFQIAIVATKIDKISRGRRTEALQRIREILKVENVIPFSAVTGEGKQQLWSLIKESA